MGRNLIELKMVDAHEATDMVSAPIKRTDLKIMSLFLLDNIKQLLQPLQDQFVRFSITLADPKKAVVNTFRLATMMHDENKLLIIQTLCEKY